MKKLISDTEYYIDITPMQEDNVVLISAEHQLGCTSEIHDLLVDFFNMGIENSKVDDIENYSVCIAESIVAEDVFELLSLVGMAKSYNVVHSGRIEKVYVPTMLYGMYGKKLCEAVKAVLQKDLTTSQRHFDIANDVDGHLDGYELRVCRCIQQS